MEPLAAGQIVAGRFRLLRPLGQGALGAVWLAREDSSQREIALKLATATAAAGQLRTEFAAARRLVHPGIVRVEEFIEGPPACLVLQYVPGTPIGALRGAGYRAVLAALVPVAEALEYAHRQGVVHRDIKASNVLRDAQGRCLLTDFGLGAAAGGGSLPGMSPQQLAGEPAAVSDDVYAFGALLYDLLAGQPLFHPGVDAERIRREAPQIPAADLGGEPLPEALRGLLGGLLQKSAAERPPGMAAVRNALEDILRDHPAASAPGVIRPLERARATPAAPLRRTGRGLPASVVVAGLVVLAIVAGGVVFYLPSLVRERGPLLRAPAPAVSAPATSVGPTAAPAPAVSQDELDAVLGAFLRDDEQLRKINAQLWGGAQWTELRRVAQAGDDAYRTRDMVAALGHYRGAADLARQLLERAPGVLSAAMAAGAAALAAGDQPQALLQFERAVAVAPDDTAARRGLERARKLDQVLAAMSRASAAEAAGQRAEALKFYRQTATLDPDWTEANAGVARLQQAAARDAYETQMARGFAAQAANDLAGARAGFEAALRLRPADANAAAALAQVESDQKLAGLTGLLAEARALARAERWADALQRYEQALAADPNLAEAREGGGQARARTELDQRLRKELGNADRFNDDAVLRKAQALLDAARAVSDPGPVLRQQVSELDQLLGVAVTPVRVMLESDNLTDVTVFKVGRLGVFSSRTLELRPGAYTAVGSRPGYRDVRRNFRVSPGNDAAVVVRCEERI